MNDVRAPNTATEQRRASQRDALTLAAEAAIAQGGLPALKARDLARAIGVALGAVYNLVPDLDALAMRVASRTLARMEEQVMAASPGAAASPTQKLIAFAHAYHRFASANKQLWRALFEHRRAAAAPDWLIDDQMRLFSHVSAALSPLLPGADERALFIASRTLFSAVHGVVLLGLEEKLAKVPVESIDAQLTLLVTAFCAGLPTNGNSI